MSTTEVLLEKVKPATSSAVVKKTKEGTLLDIVTTKGFQSQMALALPKTLTPERLTRVVMTECRKTPALLRTSRESFLGAVLQCAQLGIEPGSALGHAYLIPYGNTCNLVIGYRGMIDLARRSGQIVSLHAYCVHAHDDFTYELGLHPDIHHIPSAEADRGPVTYVYAVAQLQGGGVQFEVMSRAEVESIRSSSKAGRSGPWVSHWDEMAKKTVIRRLFKLLPVSIEVARAVEADEKTDRGEAINPQDVIDGIATDKGIEMRPMDEEETEDVPAADPETGEIKKPAKTPIKDEDLLA